MADTVTGLNTAGCDWEVGVKVGRIGGIPTGRTIYTTIAVTAGAGTINAAIAACPAGQDVKLTGSDGTVSATITGKSGVCLRGDGPGLTKLRSTVSSVMINFGTGLSEGTQIGITAGFTKESVSITAASSPSIAVGDYLAITMDDPSFVFNVDVGRTQCIYSMHKAIAGTSGTTINFWPPLPWAASGLNPKVAKLSGTACEDAGLEDLDLYPENSGITYTVQMGGSYGCWNKNVRFFDVPYTAWFIWQSLGCTFQTCDVYGTTSTTDGYGAELDNQTKGNTAIAFLDCGFQDLFHSVITSGMMRCVFAHCFTDREHIANVSTKQTAGYNLSHAAEGMMTLMESCMGNSMYIDHHHGGAAYNRVNRCRLHMRSSVADLSKYAAVRLDEGAYYLDFTGNVFGDPDISANTSFYKYAMTAGEFDDANETNWGGIYILGYKGYGQAYDSLVASSIKRHHNYDYWHSAVQDDEGLTGAPATSLAFPNADPSYITGGDSVAPFDYSNPDTYANDVYKLPAARRILGLDATDVTAPTPNPATIASVTVNSISQITVVATTASDETALASSPYDFAIDDVWQGYQSSATKVFTGLTSGTTYAFKTRTKDAAGNVTTASSATNGTTPSVGVSRQTRPAAKMLCSTGGF